jgi:DNA-binding MarR family transcriptional regulator
LAAAGAKKTGGFTQWTHRFAAPPVMREDVRMSAVDLSTQLGHLARRLQQANTALWHALVSEETTSPQFAVLNAVADAGAEDTDQRMVGELIGLDRSTTAEIVTRLADRGLLRRVRDPRDGRRNLLRLTEEGQATHRQMARRVAAMNKVALAPRDPDERKTLLELMWRVVTAADSLKT